MKTINNEVIRSLTPCYDPSEIGIPDNETLSVLEWVEKYREVVTPTDIVWLLARPHFITEKNLRLFAVWCAREALKLTAEPDPRSIEACDVAEKYANGEATAEELESARVAAIHADDAAYWAAYPTAAEAAAHAASAASAAARTAAAQATDYATYCVADAATAASQLDKLLTYFK